MLHMFQALPTHPRLFVFKSMVIHDVEGIPKTVLEMEVFPKIEQIAADTHSIIINYHDAFITHPEYFPDGVHPNNAGTVAIGKFVADIIVAALSAAPDAGASDGAVATDASDAAGLPATDAGSDGSSTEVSAPASGSGGSGTGGSGAGGAGTGGASSSGNSGTGGTPGAPGASSGSSGCALAAGSAPPSSAYWLLALPMMFVVAARRRRR
jgi:MYXO-CTERM domain-containing protein